MNIFCVHDDPVYAAQMLCDKHIPKMTVESAQMLSTVHRMLDGELCKIPSKSGKRMVKGWKLPDPEMDAVLYKAVHIGHPSTVWTAATSENYTWHYLHFIALGLEFKHRFGKDHATMKLLKVPLSHLPKNIKIAPRTPFALAMKAYPQCIVPGDPVQSYRNFYYADKVKFAKWERNREAPEWWNKMKESQNV